MHGRRLGHRPKSSWRYARESSRRSLLLTRAKDSYSRRRNKWLGSEHTPTHPTPYPSQGRPPAVAHTPQHKLTRPPPPPVEPAVVILTKQNQELQDTVDSLTADLGRLQKELDFAKRKLEAYKQSHQGRERLWKEKLDRARDSAPDHTTPPDA